MRFLCDRRRGGVAPIGRRTTRQRRPPTGRPRGAAYKKVRPARGRRRLRWSDRGAALWTLRPARSRPAQRAVQRRALGQTGRERPSAARSVRLRESGATVHSERRPGRCVAGVYRPAALSAAAKIKSSSAAGGKRPSPLRRPRRPSVIGRGVTSRWRHQSHVQRRARFTRSVIGAGRCLIAGSVRLVIRQKPSTIPSTFAVRSPPTSVPRPGPSFSGPSR